MMKQFAIFCKIQKLHVSNHERIGRMMSFFNANCIITYLLVRILTDHLTDSHLEFCVEKKHASFWCRFLVQAELFVSFECVML